MSVTRRQILLGGTGFILAGCATDPVADRPGVMWPHDPNRPVVVGPGAPVAPGAPGQPAPVRPTPQPQPTTPAPSTTTAAGPGNVRVLSRSTWAKADPIQSRINKMGDVDLITVHHEGWTPVWFEDSGTTAARIETIRKSHLERLRAGDIGYHYVIDRAGRVWEGRNIAYQGAHVSENNENNLGIMCLGNFDQQQPTQAQLGSLRSTLVALMKQHRVPARKVYTHQEIKPTSCPGKVLQASMVQMRRNGLA